MRVRPTGESTCPSCGAQIDPDAKPPVMREVVLRDGENLPDVCFQCGESTERRVAFDSSRTIGGENPIMLALAAVGGVFSLMAAPRATIGAAGVGDVRAKHSSISRMLPACARCVKSSRAIKARYVDHESREVVLTAHRRFDKALRALRRASRA